MQASYIFKTSILSLCLIAAGCSSSSDISKRNANYMGVRIKDGGLSGTYNPAVYNPKLVKAQIKNQCNGDKLASYGEVATDGLVNFTATCSAGTVRKGGFVEIERMKSGNYLHEGTYY